LLLSKVFRLPTSSPSSDVLTIKILLFSVAPSQVRDGIRNNRVLEQVFLYTELPPYPSMSGSLLVSSFLVRHVRLCKALPFSNLLKTVDLNHQYYSTRCRQRMNRAHLSFDISVVVLVSLSRDHFHCLFCILKIGCFPPKLPSPKPVYLPGFHKNGSGFFHQHQSNCLCACNWRGFPLVCAKLHN